MTHASDAVDSHSVTCRCGKVVFHAAGRPLLAASCYCNSCQRAGQEFEKLTPAPRLQDADGGTQAVLYRKDRVRCKTGMEYLKEFRLKPDSPTRRVIASCCNSPMFLDFTRGHWVSIYRGRFNGDAPPMEMRVMTRERPGDVTLPDDVPNHDGHSGRFLLTLVLTWIAMGFRRPDMGLQNIRKL